MARYISLLSWTEQGLRGAKDTLNRASAVRKAFQEKGGQLIDVYWTFGPFDVVVVFDAPDDEMAYQLMMKVGMQGNVKSSTMRAFNEQDMARIIKAIA